MKSKDHLWVIIHLLSVFDFFLFKILCSYSFIFVMLCFYYQIIYFKAMELITNLATSKGSEHVCEVLYLFYCFCCTICFWVSLAIFYILVWLMLLYLDMYIIQGCNFLTIFLSKPKILEHNTIYVCDDFSQSGTFELVLLYLTSFLDAQHYISKRN